MSEDIWKRVDEEDSMRDKRREIIKLLQRIDMEKVYKMYREALTRDIERNAQTRFRSMSEIWKMPYLRNPFPQPVYQPA